MPGDSLLQKRAAAVRLALFDVDGVLTDGRLYMGPDGFEMKVFHTRDGHGLKALAAAGIEVGVISGRRSAAVEDRMRQLGIRHLHQGIEDELGCFRALCGELGIAAEDCAFLGDDVVDLEVMRACGLAAAVADAHPAVLDAAHWRSERPGGFGAAREFCDLILAARGEATDYAGN
jgi:3-deoxy-D-manno-octulosonate 8-phosphate phosphatase (KDO 8-P phosphatase)